MRRGRSICVRAPPPRIKRLLSIDSLKTIIVTLQGVHAVYFLFSDGWNSLAQQFMPLAIIGLVRLPAALWLTDDWLFVDAAHPDHVPAISLQVMPASKMDDETILHLTQDETPYRRWSSVGMGSSYGPSGALHDTTSIRGIAIRGFYMTAVLGVIGLSIYVPISITLSKSVYTATILLRTVFYILVCVISGGIFAGYVFRRKPWAQSTVIPCIASPWYKAYTCLMILLMIVMIIIAALETRRTPCGIYTLHTEAVDSQVCPGLVFLNSTISVPAKD